MPQPVRPAQRYAADRDAVHQALFALIVVDGVVPGGAVVPEGDRTFAPLEAAGEFRPHGMGIEIVKQRLALEGIPAFEMGGEGGVHIKRLAPTQWMRDHDGMHRLADKALALEAGRLIARLVGTRGAEDMSVGVDGAQALKGLFQAIGQCVVGLVHIGKQRVAALVRQHAGDEDRAHRRFDIVGMVGVPAAADIDHLFLLLPHLGNLRVPAVGREELVDVDIAPAPREGDVLFRRQFLVAEEDHAIVAIGGADRLHVAVRGAGDVDTQHLGAAAARHLPNFDRTHDFLHAICRLSGHGLRLGGRLI